MSTFSAPKKLIGLWIVILLIFAGCGGNAAIAPSQPQTGGDKEAPAEQPAAARSRDSGEPPADVGHADGDDEADTGYSSEPAPAGVVAEKGESEEAAASGDGGRTGGGEDTASSVAPAATSSPGGPASAAPAEDDLARDESTIPDAVPQQTEPLKAGEIDDNARWDEYLSYLGRYQGPSVHKRDVSERYVVEVVDGQQQPVLDAQVRILNNGQEVYTARTCANGQVLFHPLALNISPSQTDNFSVEVVKGNFQEQFALARLDPQATGSFSDRWTVTLDAQKESDTVNLDILFLVDATGSMADEITKIQTTIFDVSAQIDQLSGRPNVRYGLVAYRDHGDAYVTQEYQFTASVNEFSANLNQISADGGGDYPEALNEALHSALNNVEWRGEDTVRLVFLVADAPPHLDSTQQYDYAQEMDNAARRGIKIFSIASSGLDDQGEYVFRQLAQYTQGRFIFLTYEDASGGGGGPSGDETSHHVDDYSVANLDDLLVKLVTEELAYQNPQLNRAQQ